jgi:hypothetical protein
MARVLLKFDVVSFWHAGTGRGAGAELDAVAHRTAGGLPVLPGRTVRGLMREGLRAALALRAVSDPALEHRLFGSSLDATPGTDDVVARFEEKRYATEPGRLVFGSARVGTSLDDADRWERWATTPEGRSRVGHLFRPFASTKLRDGVAEDQTLRAIELVVPLVLVAEVTATAGSDAVDWRAPLEIAARFVRGIGSHRNRGLGRVATSLEVQS